MDDVAIKHLGFGVNIIYSALISFVLIGAGFALVRCLPKRHTS